MGIFLGDFNWLNLRLNEMKGSKNYKQKIVNYLHAIERTV